MNEKTVSEEIVSEEIVSEGAEGGKAAGRGRRLLRNALVAVLVLGAVGGGVAYTAVTAAGADRTAPTVAWAEPTTTAAPADPAAGAVKGRASTPLSKLLLPVPDGYALGSDIEGYGNDAEVPAGQAAALVKRSGQGFYGKQRRAYEKEVDRLGIQGMALRSYAADTDEFQVEISILRMKDKQAVRRFHLLRNGLADSLKLRKGPKVKGHEKNASCHLGPRPEEPENEEEGASLEYMDCSAYDGEFMIYVIAYGTTPFDGAAVAELTEQQLRHIESPGEYV